MNIFTIRLYIKTTLPKVHNFKNIYNEYEREHRLINALKKDVH